MDDLRAALKKPLHEALHDLDVQVAGLPVDGCHCNLVAEVVLDAIMPVLAANTGGEQDGN